jgi:hypothetical protein
MTGHHLVTTRSPFYEPRVVSYHNDHGALAAEVVMLHGYYAVKLFTGEESKTEFYTMRRDAHAVAKCHTERYS